MRTVKLPDRSFKVKFKIFRFGFTDFDVFVRRFTEAASWRIADLNEFSHTYIFENSWNITLHPHGDISLYSPLLKREQACDVYAVIDVLIAMDVRLGENCEVEMHYEGEIGSGNGLPFLAGIPIAALAAASFALLLATKTAQMVYARILTIPVLLFFESAAFIFTLAFAYFLYKSTNRNKQSFEEVLLQSSNERIHEDFMRNEDIRRKLKDQVSIHSMDLVREMGYPLENIMAYTRFYASHTDPNTQHWKDLMEIMEQSIQIRSVMNRVESQFKADGERSDQIDDQSKNLFRKSQRRMDLVPLDVHGTDLLGDSFETPSFTLNISESGACLLLPDSLVAVGQGLELRSHEFEKKAIVRWVVEGKIRSMMFAGVEFLKVEDHPTKTSESSHSTAGVLSFADQNP